MTVYVDEIREYASGMWCHMTADTEQELHAMAALLGLRRSYFQHPPRHSVPHYDLRRSKRIMALQYGAAFKPGLEQARERLKAKGLLK